MTSPFAQPDDAASDYDKFSPQQHPEWLNRLLLIRPHEVRTVTFDDSGPKDFVYAYVIFVDLMDPATGRPLVLPNASIGGAGLFPQLKNKINDFVLGRLVQKPQNGAKTGAFYITDFTDADAQLALPHLNTIPPYVKPTPFTAAVAEPATAPVQQPAWQPPATVQAPTPAADPWQTTAPVQPVWTPPQPAQPPAMDDPANAQLVAFLRSKGIAVTAALSKDAMVTLANQAAAS